MPTVVFWIAGAVGAVAAAKWIITESRRINAQLHPERHADMAASDQPLEVGRLRRDANGVYRPE